MELIKEYIGESCAFSEVYGTEERALAKGVLMGNKKVSKADKLTICRDNFSGLETFVEYAIKDAQCMQQSKRIRNRSPKVCA